MNIKKSQVPSKPVSSAIPSDKSTKRAQSMRSSKSGLSHWWAQRITAVALVPLSLWLMNFLASTSHTTPHSHEIWVLHFQNTSTMVLMSLFVLFGFYHAQLGVQTVAEDYIKGDFLQLLVILFVKFATLLLGITALLSILKIYVG